MFYFIFRLTKLSTDLLKFPHLAMMKFHWKPAQREAHPPPPYPPLHLHQFSLEWDPCLQTGRLTRSSSKFTLPSQALREMFRSSGSISTPSQRRTCQMVHPPAPPAPPAPPVGWGGEERRDCASPGVCRAPVSPSLRSPPSLSVSPPARLPASKVGF